jgi:pyruvate formate lyase activating enzyme
MKIGYVQKTSFIDYPGKICAVVFTQGCNFRCPYCHNPELVDKGRYGDSIFIGDVYTFLEKRRGKLDAVVISGGEPTLQPDLIAFLQKIKSMGYLVKLDTNGSRPKVIQEALRENVIDYIAMDIKAPWDKYSLVAGSLINITHIKESIALLMASGIAYEFRTTIVNTLLCPGDVMNIATMIQGAQLYILQKFVSSKHLDPTYSKESSFTDKEMENLIIELSYQVKRCFAR